MIAVDWGGSSLRLYRLDAQGGILDKRRSDQGVLACGGRFAEVLAAQIEGWGDTLVVLSGMVGSRNGWHEMPYLDCPADLQELARAMRELDTHGLTGRRLWLTPGLRHCPPSGVLDVMRGEETQILGLPASLSSGMHQVCLPGTHSKWVTLQDGRIRRFSTSMTGEVYALLRRHSILGKLMAEDDHGFAEDAFDGGLDRSGGPGGLLHHLFGVRTEGLFERYAGDELPSFLSGLLIGHEIRGLRASGSPPGPAPMHVIGSDHLRTRYARGFARLGVDAFWHDEDRVAVGLHRLAESAGLLSR
jgi:2-dehydro-3-deoxygalactonokinase